jgi:hypothetical protein
MLNKIPGTQWRHYKRGEVYFILLEGVQESDLTDQFIYAKLNENNLFNRILLRSLLFFLNLLIQKEKVWVRRKKENLSSAKVGEGDQVVPRFRRID